MEALNYNQLSPPNIGLNLTGWSDAASRAMNVAPIFKSPIMQIKNEPMRERELTTGEMLKLFDKEEALQIAYIPHFMTQCALHYAEVLTDYTRENRLGEYKKQTRILLDIAKEYIYSLRSEMPAKVFERFMSQRKQYLEMCGANLTLAYFTVGNQFLKQFGAVEHNTVYYIANLIIALIEGVEAFDKKVNRSITRKIGKPCRNNGDARLMEIKNVCLSMIKGRSVSSSPQVELCVKVMESKARTLIKNMINE